MQRASSRDERLNFYADESNFDRAQKILKSFEASKKDISPALPRVDLDVIVLNLNSSELMNQIAEGANKVIPEFESNGFSVRFLIGDTGSTEIEVLNLYEEAANDSFRVVKDLVYNFSACNNDLARMGNSDFKLFLNNDVLIKDNPGAILQSFLKIKSDSNVGIIGLKLDFPDKTVQHKGIEFLTESRVRGLPYHPDAKSNAMHEIGSAKYFHATTGAYLMIRSSQFFEVGGFNESYAAECQDVELCLAINRLGFRCLVLDAGALVHIENYTRPKGEENWADRRYFLRRWTSYIETLIA